MRSVLYRARVILDLDPENIPLLLVGAKKIHGKMVENAGVLSSPSPDMATLEAQIADLDRAQLATKVAKGVTSVRDQKRDVLWSSLQSERAYVQVLCDKAPEMAATYAEMAGMSLAKRPDHQKPLLEALLTPIKGDVEVRANASQLTALAGKSPWTAKTFLWRHTLDQEKTWLLDDPTTIAKTLLHGLPLGVEAGFQVAIKDSKGPGEWSQTVRLFVH